MASRFTSICRSQNVVGNDEEAWYLVHYGPKGREGAHETVTPTIPAIYIGA